MPPLAIGVGFLVVGALVELSGGDPQGADVLGLGFMAMGGVLTAVQRHNHNHYQNEANGQTTE